MYECYLTGEHERALEAQRCALEIWRALGNRLKEGDALRWLSRLSWVAGDGAQANQYSADAIRTLESLPPARSWPWAYCNQADLDLEAHEIDSAIGWAQRAITLAEPWSNSEILCDAFNALGTVRLIGGDTAGWADLDRSLQLALACDLGATGGQRLYEPRRHGSFAAVNTNRRRAICRRTERTANSVIWTISGSTWSPTARA